MNKSYFTILVAFLVFLSHQVYGNERSSQSSDSDSLLYNIQEKVYGAFLASFQDRGTARLVEIESHLKAFPVQNQLTSYWIAYAKYCEAIYYIKFQEKKKCREELDSAIGILEKVTDKNTETYALLAYIQSFSIQFSSGMAVAALSKKVRKNAEKAIELDSMNVRAWFILASNDYYTPPAFGGGKKCEAWLLKAISLEEQTIPNPYMPSWGKSEAYQLLISYYINNKDYSKAKDYLNTALSLYPDDYMINQYVEVLKDKK
jgi:tetratricopeptide (TPR) repeat protein